MRTEYSSGMKEVDTDFEFEGQDFWYKARVYYDTSFSPAIFDPIDAACPAERSFECEVVIDEITQNIDTVGGWEEVSLKIDLLEKNLQEAIEEDAAMSVEEDLK